MLYVAIIISTLLAGFIQGVSGFGAGIVFMSIIPYFLSVISSATISNCMSVFLNVMMTYYYRKSIKMNLLLVPSIFFILGGTISILFVTKINTDFLKLFLGIFLIVLAVYFILFSNKIKIKANILTMFICGFISGICDGLFGIGGPLMVLFFLSLTHSKEEYLGTISMFFLIVCTYNMILRIFRGIFTISLLPYAILSIFMVFIGLQIGNRVVCKIDDQLLKKLTYVLIGVSGFITFVTALV